jgi:hypothetical protein
MSSQGLSTSQVEGAKFVALRLLTAYRESLSKECVVNPTLIMDVEIVVAVGLTWVSGGGHTPIVQYDNASVG